MNGIHVLEHPLGRFDPTRRSSRTLNALEAALKYAARGWYVYAPDATTDEARIREHYKNLEANTVKINVELSGLVALEFEE